MINNFQNQGIDLIVKKAFKFVVCYRLTSFFMEKLIFIAEIFYALVVLAVTIKIIYDTHDSVKTLGYLLLIVFLPIVGIIFYFSFGVNYRKQKLYSKKIVRNNTLFQSLYEYIMAKSKEQIDVHKELLDNKASLAQMMLTGSSSPLAEISDLKLLINGEAKFPEVLAALEQARDHIHIEYYIYADDHIGNQIKDILIRKAREGIKVRFIYDDFASHKLGRRMVKELRNAGVEVFPFYKVRIFMLANRMNYRNHRKIIVVDGEYGFVGGINVDDRYINDGKNKLYWRDTHLSFRGHAVGGLQYVFISDWNFCARQQIEITNRYFPISNVPTRPDSLVQIINSGPDSELAEIMLSYMGAISAANSRIFVTTPYFIPNETIMNAMKTAALKGIDVRLLVPGISDSRLVNAASCSNYQELLEVGVRIYRYNKGFVHAKTMVVDDNLSIIGTANMDIRSYDLNFEINAMVFDRQLNSELAAAFMNDLQGSQELNLEEWKSRRKWIQFGETLARLVSPLL